MNKETTSIRQLGTNPTVEDLATTHAHPTRFSEEVYALNEYGFSQRICIGGCQPRTAPAPEAINPT